MEESETDQMRHWQLPSVFLSDRCLVIGHFALSLVLGGIGGLLLGATALLALQSLEIVADNRLLMDQLENYITDAEYFFERMAKRLPWESYNQVHAIHISLFAQLFGIFCIVVSSVVGLLLGFAAYAYKIKTSGEASSKKAMTRAVPVFLFFTTATGCALGLCLEGFLSLTVNVYVSVWFFISLFTFFVPRFIVGSFLKPQCLMHALTVALMVQPGASFIAFLSTFWSSSRLTLGFPLIVPRVFSSVSCASTAFAAIVPLMLIIADIFNIAGQPVVAIVSPTSTNTTNIAIESIFIGILTSQLLMAVIGIILFEIWQMGGAYKVCGSAAAFGSTVWGIMKGALNGMGPGPIIGGLMGVAGAVGVSLSAAAATADKPVPRLGVMVGAAAGASMSTFGHSGLSRVFMGLCAATIPAGYFLKMLFSSTQWGFKAFYCLSLLLPLVLILLTHTSIFRELFFVFQGTCGLIFIALYYPLVMPITELSLLN